MSMRVQSPEILLRLRHIPPNLLFQSFDGRKLDLIAQTIQKMKFDFRFRRKFERVEIQQVSFNGKRIGAKRGPVPNVRDRVETLIADAGAGDIDAVFGHEFFVVRQVDSGYGVLRSVAASTAGGRENAEWTRQQMPRPADSAFGKQLSNVAARNPLAAQAHLGIIMDLKS